MEDRLRGLLSYYIIILCGLFGLFFSNAKDADAANYTLSVINTHQSISCDKLRLNPDCFMCKRGDFTYKYNTDAIETVTFKGEVIYPYDSSVTVTEADLNDADCDFLIENLRSPLLLEEDPEIFILVGTMYEEGICTRKNIQRAYFYYRRAGKPGMQRYTALRKKTS